MPQQLPQIYERDAPAEIAAIYADMRQVMRLPMVNLIYRHIATLPGALPWVWGLLRPQLLSGRIEDAAHRIVATQSQPALAPLTQAELRAARLNAAEEAQARRVIAAYNRGNALNMVNLTAVRLALDLPDLPQRAEPPAPAPLYAPPDAPLDSPPMLPPMPRPDQLEPATAARLDAIAQLHNGDNVIPSLYLHLALWPEFLALACERLTPALCDGTIARQRDTVVRGADTEARRIAPLLTSDAPYPAAHVPAMRAALDTFTRNLIPEMVAVGLALERALPS